MQYNPHFEMNYCRRCGSALSQQAEGSHVFICDQGHPIFANASPAVALLIQNDANEVLLVRRASDPGKGMWDAPGGFCDGTEPAEEAAIREVREEIGLEPEQYTAPELLFTMPNQYAYKDEVLPTLDINFRARVKGTVQPVAADDAASVAWVDLRSLDMDDVAFVTIRRALE